MLHPLWKGANGAAAWCMLGVGGGVAREMSFGRRSTCTQQMAALRDRPTNRSQEQRHRGVSGRPHTVEDSVADWCVWCA
jgi:hypothetical protein